MTSCARARDWSVEGARLAACGKKSDETEPTNHVALDGAGAVPVGWLGNDNGSSGWEEPAGQASAAPQGRQEAAPASGE